MTEPPIRIELRAVVVYAGLDAVFEHQLGSVEGQNYDEVASGFGDLLDTMSLTWNEVTGR